MQCTADFPDRLSDPRFPEAADVLDDAAALDAAVDMLNAHAPTSDAPIRRLLRPRELPFLWLPGWHDGFHLRARERQEAQILEQPAARGQRVGRRIGNALIVGTAGVRLTQKENRERHVDEQHVFHRMVFFLAAITARLLSRILGALDASFGPIVPKRGEASAGAGAVTGSSDVVGDPTTAAALAAATPMRWAKSVKDRLGASPSLRRVACSTTTRT